MKLLTLISSKISLAWNWLNGLIIGLIVGCMGASIAICWWLDDEFNIGMAQKSKKKK